MEKENVNPTSAEWDLKVFGMQDFHYFIHCIELSIVKRLKILHIADIILKLLYTAHSGQYAQHSVKACGKSYSIACNTAAVESA